MTIKIEIEPPTPTAWDRLVDREVVAPLKVSLDGHKDEKTGVTYIGEATRREDGKYVCLANVQGCLCLVEVSITPETKDYLGVAVT